jgi:hypothetical protein
MDPLAATTGRPGARLALRVREERSTETPAEVEASGGAGPSAGGVVLGGWHHSAAGGGPGGADAHAILLLSISFYTTDGGMEAVCWLMRGVFLGGRACLPGHAHVPLLVLGGVLVLPTQRGRAPLEAWASAGL